MTPDSRDPNAPQDNSESVVGSDSALGLVPPPEEVSEGSSIFDHHVRAAPQSFSDAAPDLMQGSREFVLPGEELSHDPVQADAEAIAPSDEASVDVPPENMPADASGDADAEMAASEETEATFVDSTDAEVTADEGDVTATVEPETEGVLETPAENSDSSETETSAESSEPLADGEELPAWETASEPSAAETLETELVPSAADAEAPAEDDQAALAAFGGLAAGAALAGGSPWSDTETSAAADSAPSYRPAAPAAPKRDLVKIALISYAVLATLAAGILWKRLADKTYREQTLENLPDTRTLKVGQVGVFSPEATLPPGHTLKLGEKRRFGNLEVEAFKVTRGMVKLEYPGDDTWPSSTEGPLVKLWLRFRNVSTDQPIPPLDKYLVFTQTRLGNSDHFATNNVLTLAADRKPFGYLLRHDHTDRTVLKDQQLDMEIPPGGTLETFIPTQPELALPEGDLLWRVHFRKGFGKRGAGVTTLIEIAFTAADVEEEGMKVGQRVADSPRAS